MLEDRTGFIINCKNKIKNNNMKIRLLRKQVTEYETIMDVIAKTDICNQILKEYREKIEICLDKINNCIEENQHNRDIIIVMKKVNKIINSKKENKSYGN